MTAGLWIYGKRSNALGGFDQVDQHVELAIRVLLLACEMGYKAVLVMPHDVQDERLEPLRWRGRPVFVSPTWRALLEETERREKEDK